MLEVYKYGGTLLKDEYTRKSIYSFFKEKRAKGIKIVMVVSAFGRENDCFSTDNLAKNIQTLNNKDKDQIMTFGEIYSSLIIKKELIDEGFKATNLYYDEIGIMCDDNYQNGNIKNVNMGYLEEVLENNEVVVVPGFIGESSEGRIISLGRNTSDLTAIIIAKYFNLEKANIIKEVDGVFKKDPKKEVTSHIIKNISYEQMLSLICAGSKMFSKKTLEYAKENEVIIEVKGLNKENSSVISNLKSEDEILFIDRENDKIKIVFKSMEVFYEIFKDLVNYKVKLEDIVIVNNIAYLKGNIAKVYEIINKYL